MQIAHEFLAQTFQHMAHLHAEIARMQEEILTLTRENVHMNKQVTEWQLRQHTNGPLADDGLDESPAALPPTTRRQPL